MAQYRNFKVVTYIPAAVTARGTKEQIESDLAFLEKYVGLDKVYLETYRGDTWASRDQVMLWKALLEQHGIEVSGGFTTVTDDIPGNGDEKRQRLFGTYCYSNEAMREKIRKVSEFTASIFDEVILDDYYFTNCTCEDCIRRKGSRTWKEYRRDLMVDVSKNLIVGPAKSVNPKVKMIVKFPNWRESFAYTGYRPDSTCLNISAILSCGGWKMRRPAAMAAAGSIPISAGPRTGIWSRPISRHCQAPGRSCCSSGAI